MSRSSTQLTAARKEEIIAACAKLYEEKGFRDTTIKEIGAAITLTRTGIYVYFETKEEIFLALLAREYDAWTAEMREIMKAEESLTRREVAAVLAKTLTNHPRLLRLLSMNLYEMEANSRPERLTEFKRSYGASLETVEAMVAKFIPDMSEDQRKRFLFAFFPFIYGIYPYTSVTDKQRDAMREAEVPYQYYSAYDLTYACVTKLLQEGMN